MKIVVFLFLLAAGLCFFWLTASANDCLVNHEIISQIQTVEISNCSYENPHQVRQFFFYSNNKRHFVRYWKGGYSKKLRVREIGMNEVINTCKNRIVAQNHFERFKHLKKYFSISNPNLNPGVRSESQLQPLSSQSIEIQLMSLAQACQDYSYEEANREFLSELVYKGLTE